MTTIPPTNNDTNEATGQIELSPGWYRAQVRHWYHAAIEQLPETEPRPAPIDELLALGLAMVHTMEAIDAHDVPTTLAFQAFQHTRLACQNALHWVCAELRWWRYEPTPQWIAEQYYTIEAMRRERSS